MRARSYQALGDLFVVVWSDGHESYYPLEDLRRACPCAHCAGEPDLFGRMSRGSDLPWTEQSTELASVERVGNYAIQLNWADGHVWGIWTFDRLRAFCPCEQCREKEANLGE